MISKDETKKKLTPFLDKKNTFSYRVATIIKNEEFDKPLSSQELTNILNETPGRKIKNTNLSALMKPLLKEEIIKIKNIVNGKKKELCWYPGWMDKKNVVNSFTSKKMEIQNLELGSVTQDNRLLKACEANYNAKNYWDTTFNALRHLEVRVRNRSRLPSSDVGTDLMEKAFRPHNGALIVPSCATAGEQDGFKSILKGMMMFHRNAKGHREEQIDKTLALKIIGYVDYLLQIIDAAERQV